MTVKEYLGQANPLKQAIERKHEQIMELQAMAERATASFTALRMSGTARRSKVEDAIVRMDSVKEELAELMAEYLERYREINRVIESVENPTARELLSLRYLSLLTWEEIAEKMGYCYVHVVHRLHPKALLFVKIPGSETASCDSIPAHAH